MPRKKFIDDKIKKSGAETGDLIRIKTNDNIYEGVLMPHHSFSDEDIVTIKLNSGYNIGLALDEKSEIKLIKKNKKIGKKFKEIPFDKNKPTVSVIGTGGTIACYVDYRTGAVHPATSAEDLAFSVPEVYDICNIKAQVAFQILSEDMEPVYWQKLARIVANELNNGSRGVVIPHGTDTLGYTSAALSFMLKNLTGPVVLVGAQRSSDRPSSDAALNFTDAVSIAAKSDIGEVVTAMHSSISDKATSIHRGTKVRKFHTSRRDAFKTVNDKPIGIVENGENKLTEEYHNFNKGKVEVDDELDTNVAMIYCLPGLKPEDLPEKKGIVLVGTGLGHISQKMIPRIKELQEKNNTIFVMTSQCFFGRVNLNVYSNGRDIKNIGVIPCEDMLPETAYVKLMWALGHESNYEKIKKLMMKNIAGEISDRTKSDVFL